MANPLGLSADFTVPNDGTLAEANAYVTNARIALGDVVIEIASGNYSTSIRPAATGTGISNRAIYVAQTGATVVIEDIQRGIDLSSRNWCYVYGIDVDNTNNFISVDNASYNKIENFAFTNQNDPGSSTSKAAIYMAVGSGARYNMFKNGSFDHTGDLNLSLLTEKGEVIYERDDTVDWSANRGHFAFVDVAFTHNGHNILNLKHEHDWVKRCSFDTGWEDVAGFPDNIGQRAFEIEGAPDVENGYHVIEQCFCTGAKDAADGTDNQDFGKWGSRHMIVRDTVVYECWSGGIVGTFGTPSSTKRVTRNSYYNNTIFRVGGPGIYAIVRDDEPAWPSFPPAFEDGGILNNLIVWDRMGAALNSNGWDPGIRYGDTDIRYDLRGTATTEDIEIAGNICQPYDGKTDNIAVIHYGANGTFASFDTQQIYGNTRTDQPITTIFDGVTPSTTLASYRPGSSSDVLNAALPLATVTQSSTNSTRVFMDKPWRFTDDKGWGATGLDTDNDLIGDWIKIGNEITQVQGVSTHGNHTATATSALYLDVSPAITVTVGQTVSRYEYIDVGAVQRTAAGGGGVVTTAANDSDTAVSASTGNSITVLANDTNAEGSSDLLTITQVQGAASPQATDLGGLATIVSGTPDTISYNAPTVTVTSVDTFTYDIDDGNSGTDTGTVSVTVTPSSSGTTDTLIIHDQCNGVAEADINGRTPDTVNNGNNWVDASSGAISAGGDSFDWGSNFAEACSIDCGVNEDIKIIAEWEWPGANGVSTGSPALVMSWRSSDPAAGGQTDYLGNTCLYAKIRPAVDSISIYQYDYPTTPANPGEDGTGIGGNTIIGLGDATTFKVRITTNGTTHTVEVALDAGAYVEYWSDTVVLTGQYAAIGQRNSDSGGFPPEMLDYKVYTIGSGAPSINTAAANDTLSAVSKNSGTTEILASTLINNDTDTAGNSPPVNEMRIVSVSVQPTSNCSVSLNPSFNVDFTPDTDFSGGNATFQYVVEDTTDSSQSTVATVTVPVDNDAPVKAGPFSATVGKNSQIIIDPDTGISSPVGKMTPIQALATDPNGDSLIWQMITGATFGNAVVDEGLVKYTPSTGYTGPDSFTVGARDEDSPPLNNHADPTIINVTVAAPNAVNDTAETVNGTPVTIDALANDEDPLGDAEIVDINNGGITDVQTTLGTATLSGTSIVYTPAASGQDSFTYTIQDSSLAQSTATISVNIDQAATISVEDVTTTGFASSYTMTIDLDQHASVNDATLDLLYTIITVPTNGTASLADNLLSYVTTTGLADSIEIEVDATGALDPKILNITILAYQDVDPNRDVPIAREDRTVTV